MFNIETTNDLIQLDTLLMEMVADSDSSNRTSIYLDIVNQLAYLCQINSIEQHRQRAGYISKILRSHFLLIFSYNLFILFYRCVIAFSGPITNPLCTIFEGLIESQNDIHLLKSLFTPDK